MYMDLSDDCYSCMKGFKVAQEACTLTFAETCQSETVPPAAGIRCLRMRASPQVGIDGPIDRLEAALALWSRVSIDDISPRGGA